MIQEEFDQLVADRNKLIADSLDNFLVNSFTSMRLPANELIVDSPHNSNGTNDIPPPVEEEGGV